MASAPVAAKHICLSVTRFRDLVAAGTIKHAPRGEYDLDAVREQYIGYLQSVASGRGGTDGAGLSKQRTQLEKARTEAILFKNSINRGDFVSLKTLSKVFEREFANIRERLLSTPGKCADSLQPFTPKDRNDIYEILYEEACAALTDLSDPQFVQRAATEARANGRNRSSAAADSEVPEVAA